jgi:hypothetical protein
MSGDCTRLVIAGASIVLCVANVPGLAQSNAARWRTASVESIYPTSADAVAVYSDSSLVSDAMVLPANLSVPSTYRTVLETMLARSAMFRRQCLRLAAAPHLEIAVRLLHPNGGRVRARTQIRPEGDGRISALVEINPADDFMELLAHELEHIIEQLDGIDLDAKAVLPASGVRRCADKTFETTRAIRVGTMVAHQARAGR